MSAKRQIEEAEKEKPRKRAKLLANLDPQPKLNASRDNFIALTTFVPRPRVVGAQYKTSTPRESMSISPPASSPPST